jgi:lipopolysaccharide/colanic/teichoic acid biosynthesis glycosyltransferase
MNKQHSGIEQQVGLRERRMPVWKRLLDLSLIVMLSPGLLLLGGLVALLIKVGSPGPILFRQQRVGFKGRQFVLFKFRTMRADAESDSHRRHTQELIRSQSPMVKLDARRDPRLIPFGSLLRVTGLDELPQLINVARGEMSLVGPRPCIPYECEAYEPWHWGRFDTVPGLTGLWQVSGKNRTTFDEMVRLDIEYSKRMGLGLDLEIMLKTIPALWGQYCDLQVARNQAAPSKSTNAEKSVESYSL